MTSFSRKPTKKTKQTPACVVDGRTMADALGVTLRRVQQLADDGTVIRVGRDRYGLVASLRRVRESQPNSEDRSLSDLRRRKIALEVESLELDVGAKRRSLVEMESAGRAVDAEYAACRSRLLVIPTKCAPIVATMTEVDDCRGVLEAAIEEALAELSGDAIARHH